MDGLIRKKGKKLVYPNVSASKEKRFFLREEEKEWSGGTLEQIRTPALNSMRYKPGVMVHIYYPSYWGC